jgi:tetratricopeptide (TPR) repeat protein
VDAAALPALLVALTRRRFSGILELRNGVVSKQIGWAEGLPTFAQSSRQSESLAAFLAGTGKVSAADRARLEQHHAATRRSELACAVELRLLAPSELLLAAREHLKRCLVQLFAWPALESEIRPAGAELPPAQGVDPMPLIREGIECHWSLERVVESLGDKTCRFAAAEARARSLAARLRGGEDVERLLALLDGRRTLGECLHGAGTSRAFATAWLLDAVGTLSYTDAPEHAEVSHAEPVIEVVVEQPAAGSAKERRTSHELDTDAEADRYATAVRADVERLHASIDELSYYELLALERNAGVAEVRQAYRNVAKRLHPDAIAGLGLDDLKEQANELFSRISVAHATLADPARRREYDATREVGSHDAGDRLARAETLYRKALVFLRAGRFLEGLPLLESCVSLWPDEAVYHSDLGWSLFKIANPRLPEARAALARAVQLDRSAALPLLRLSFVLAALGEDEEAQALRARAQRLDPSLRARS